MAGSPLKKARRLAAAKDIDPLTKYGEAPAEKATVVAPSAKNLGVAVVRILAVKPLTREQYRRADSAVVAQAHLEEVPARAGTPEDPFNLANLIKRHNYTIGDERITTLEQIRRGEDAEG